MVNNYNNINIIANTHIHTITLYHLLSYYTTLQFYLAHAHMRLGHSYSESTQMAQSSITVLKFFCIVSNFNMMKTDTFSACWVILLFPQSTKL